MAGEELQVGVAFDEAGCFQLDHGEAVEQILAEGLFGDHGAEVVVGGGDDAHVDFAGLQGAQPLDLLILEGAEELGLGGDGHVADFVEEEGAVVRVFKEANLVLKGAGEGALDVAEEFAFKEGFDDGGTVEGNEWSGGGGAKLVEGFGDQLFAGSGGAGDEQGAVVRGDALNLGIELPHGRAVADHAGEDGLVGQRAFEFLGAEAGAVAGEQGFEACTEDVGREGLIEVVGGAFADGFDGGFRGVVSGGEDDVDGRVELDDTFEELHAGESGHDEIGEDDVGVVVEDELEALLGIGEGVCLDVEILQGRLHELHTGWTIIDDRN